MNKGKQIIYTILGIICVGILFCGAMIFPQYYNVFCDNKILNQITYMDVSLSAFETSYESFIEKISTIAHCQAEGIVLRAVKVNEIEANMDNEKLTNIVKQELKTLYKKEVLVKKVTIKEDMLSLREMYTIYTTDGEENIKGINYWKIVYDTGEYNLTILLDAEYHKIYDILVKADALPLYEEIKSSKYGKDAINMKTDTAVTDNSFTVYEIADKIILGNRNCIAYMDGIVGYYGIQSNEWFLEDEVFYAYPEKHGYNFEGIINLENDIEAGQRLGIDEYDCAYWSEGIHLEDRIEF